MNAPEPFTLTDYSEEFKVAQLKLDNSEELANQLAQLAPGTFDEIHLHAPSGPEFERAKTYALRVIAAKLKKGGRFYHSFETKSGLIDADTANEHEVNLERINQAAKNAGLKVDNFAQKTGETYTTKTGTRVNSAIHRAIRKYTDYPQFSANFAVFRKI